ncbi:VOC family protein [Leptospira ilyithenensis]|uniref:VOC family protein n=1 Tax=Leptospira ilyithenensis TaxID=2484901 RepID=A0A4R9LMG0_9LEPT|nr:VOC family protein [Leptospira ilyithenensis]TGN09741.1 VOC family protein [Leptospira ilyithenensis]
MKQKLNLITLGVSDLQKSLLFYEQGLGWKKSSASQESVAFFQLNGLVLSLFSREALAEDAHLSAEGTGFSGITIAYNAASEKEVDEVIEKVRSLGAKILKTPQKVFWGGYSSYFADPDGHIFEVAHNPFFPLNEKGEVVLPD